MESQFLGIPHVTELVFYGLVLAPFCTSFIGTATGTAGGLALLAILALVFPPAVLIPVHTVVQFGAGASRALLLRRYVMRGTLLPFFLGAVLGAAAGAQIFITLPTAALQGIIGGSILLLIWMPKIARIGAERRRFAAVGFAASFLGMFVSASGAMIAPFVASASPDRRNYVATFATMMAMVHVTKLVAIGMLGGALGAYVPLILPMIAAAGLGNWVGGRVLNRIPERRFRIVFQVLLRALALRLVWSAAGDFLA